MKARMQSAVPVLLIALLLGTLIVAVAAQAGKPATGPIPEGPAPKIFKRHKSDTLAQLAAQQRRAAAHYLGVYRSFLRWRGGAHALAASSRAGTYERCPAAGIRMPASWCWYASAWRWTTRELGETEKAIAAVKRYLDLKRQREREARAWHSVMHDWQTAVAYAQRWYPGTQSWLLSCSGAEGGHGQWVWYGGRVWGGYHVGNDFLGMDTVGGWMQFRYSTFAPYFERMSANLRGRGIEVPDFGEGRYDAWLNPLAQALTAGYMRWSGQDGHHWSASWGRGC